MKSGSRDTVSRKRYDLIMFTGIIEATAAVKQAGGSTLTLARPAMFDDLKIGGSIAVSGVCLSVTAMDDASMGFDVIPTTLNKSKLGSLKAGDSVNLERALAANGRLDGHVVLGHCEGVGKVVSIKAEGKDRIITVSIPSGLEKLIVPHGSIAVDGVSLTIAETNGKTFSVALIPLTLEHTTLGTLKEGSAVNIESDVLGRYVVGRGI